VRDREEKERISKGASKSERARERERAPESKAFRRAKRFGFFFKKIPIIF
jgi:hypothetical protein